jgi:putative serine protease PepD
LALALAACAPAQVRDRADSVVPGSIGVLVRQEAGAVIVSAVRRSGPAAAAGVRVGDIVLRLDGEAVTGQRQFYRLVLDRPPGSVVRLEVRRGATVQLLEMPVEELDTLPMV